MVRKLLMAGAVAALLAPASVFAAASGGAISPSLTAVGPRFGFSVDPDQVVVGGQLEVAGFAHNWTFDPSLEFGFGDNVTDIALNIDAKYHFVLRDSAWRPLLGAGIGVNFVSVDLPPPFRDVSNTEVGVNFIGGVSVPMRSGGDLFIELRLGAGDIPSLKGIVGWNFKI